MNKKLISSLFLTAISVTSLSSCRKVIYVDNNTITKSTYEKEMDQDYIIFSSNYTIDAIVNDMPYLKFETEHGKICITYQNTSNKNYLELTPSEGEEDLIDITRYFYLDAYTVDTDTQTLTRQEVYNYFYGYYIILLDIEYEDWIYDEDEKIYKYGGYSEEIVSASLRVEDGYPCSLKADFAAEGRFEMQFSGRNNTTVTFPSSVPSPFVVSAEVYNEQYSCEYVLFHSNYAISMSLNGTDYLYFKSDHGKIYSRFAGSNPLYFEFNLIGSTSATMYMYGYDSSGEKVESTSIKTTQEIYEYFFSPLACIFDIPFNALTYYVSQHYYTGSNIEVENSAGETTLINTVYMTFYDNAPFRLEYDISGFGNLVLIFNSLGTATVDKSEVEIN